VAIYLLHRHNVFCVIINHHVTRGLTHISISPRANRFQLWVFFHLLNINNYDIISLRFFWHVLIIDIFKIFLSWTKWTKLLCNLTGNVNFNRNLLCCMIFMCSLFLLKTSLGECSGVYGGLNGTISSPSHPSNYPNGAYCVYVITVPFGSACIEFQVFSTEDCCDRVNIYDDFTTGNLIGRCV